MGAYVITDSECYFLQGERLTAKNITRRASFSILFKNGELDCFYRKILLLYLCLINIKDKEFSQQLFPTPISENLKFHYQQTT